MIIELFGLPASGKTHLAHKFSERGFELVKINSRLELIGRSFLFLICNSWRSLRLFFFFLTNADNLSRFYVKFLNGFLQAGAKFQKAGKFEKAVLDQGFFQNMLTLFEKEKTPEQLLQFVKILPRPNFLLIVEAPEEERLSRIGRRGYQNAKSFFKKYNSPEKIRGWEKIIEDNFEAFKEIIPRSGVNYRFCKSDDSLENFIELGRL
ncbi:MAG: AAA family ATPase [Candidatus Portnoybacteria bacterium]|nr:AAA family ATPase [Candidatus Portnoybacteria bacterium]